jgi:cytochrome b
VAAGEARPGVRVWDPLVRIGHWALVLSIVLAWLTRSGGGVWHEWIGYASLALIALRIAWGWIGSGYACFTQFVRSPAATLRYARLVLAHREPRYLGHNPLGGWMVLALLVNVALVGITGWLFTTDAWWGDERMENIHNAFAISLLVLAAIHVTGVIVTSLRHRENLVAAMLHGRKRPPAEGDVS